MKTDGIMDDEDIYAKVGGSAAGAPKDKQDARDAAAPGKVVSDDRWNKGKPKENDGSVFDVANSRYVTGKGLDVNDSDAGDVVTKRQESKMSGYDKVIGWLEDKIAGYKPMSDEDKAKLRRRQKAEGIVNGIADAVGNVANLIAVHNYAPNMNDGKSSLSGKARERWEKEKAEREAEEERMFNYALQYGRLKDAQEQQEYQRGRDAQSSEMAQRALELKIRAQAAKEAKDDVYADYMSGRINGQDIANETKRRELENLKKYGVKEPNRKSGGCSGSGGRGGVKHHFLGTEYSSTKDYDEAVEEYAKKNGLDVYEEVEVGKDMFGRPKTKKVRKKTARLAAEGEMHNTKAQNNKSQRKKEVKGF